MSFGLRNKIVLSVVAIIAIFGVLATISVYTYSKSILKKQEIETMRQTSINTADELKLMFNNSLDLVKTLSRDEGIIDILKNGEMEENDKMILTHLDRFNVNNNFSAIYIMSSEGNTLASTDESFVGKNYAFRTYFKNALANNNTVSLVRGVTSQQLGYYFSFKIEDEAGGILGVVVMKMSPEVINEYLDSSEVTKNYEFMLVDEFGIVVYSNKKYREFKSLGNLTLSDEEKIKEERRFDGLKIEPLHYDELYKKLNDAGKFEIINFYDEEEKEMVFTSISKIENLPFYITIEKGVDEIDEKARRLSFILAIFVIFAAFFAGIFISILVIKSLEPLSEINQFAKEVSKGNLNIYIEPHGGIEFIQLANTFNEMVEKVKKTKENIEKQIEEKTRVLQKLNKSMTGRELKMIELKKEIKDLKEKLNDK